MKTEKEAILEARDEVFKRIVTNKLNKLNKLYWAEVLKTAKVNTPEAVEAQTNIGVNNENMKKDKLFLKLIDQKLKGYINEK